MENTYYALLETVEVMQVEKNKYALIWKNKIFYIGGLLFEIVRLLKERKSLTEISNHISVNHGAQLSDEKLSAIIQENIFNKLADTEKKAPVNEPYIRGKITLIREQLLTALSLKLTPLFYKPLFFTLLSLTFMTSFLFAKLVYDEKLFSHRISWTDGAYLALFNYLFLLVISIIHEFGHSAAAIRFGISSKEIGLGFYFIIPVLYTDVSKVWLLNKKRRLVVNIGGLYFQLLVNILLFAVFLALHTWWTAYQWIPASLFTTNTLIILYSLNPFFRNDGYWIYSDFFDITNLSKQAHNYPVTCYKYFRGQESVKSVKREVALIGYSLVKYALIALLPFWLCKTAYESLELIVEFIAHNGHIGEASPLESVFRIARVSAFCLLAALINVRTARNFFESYKAAIRQPAVAA